jgi:hypothetical protein
VATLSPISGGRLVAGIPAPSASVRAPGLAGQEVREMALGGRGASMSPGKVGDMKFKLTVVGDAGDCARDLRDFERRAAAALESIDAGLSVYRLELCIELSDLRARQPWYAGLRSYMAFRPRTHGLVGVCAVDAPALRADTNRVARLARAFDELAARTRITKKFPYDFRGDLFRRAVRELVAACARGERMQPLE